MLSNKTVNRPSLGVGVGLRSEHYPYILQHNPPISWFEAISENYLGAGGKLGSRPFKTLCKVRENYPVVLHGVSLSIGSIDPLNFEYLKQLKELYLAIEPTLVSDHLCWTGVGGKNLHDLLPLPYTEEAISHVCERILRVQDTIGRRLLLENVSSYLSYTHSEMSEWEFLSEVANRADCYILLDINNIYVSARNHDFDPQLYLEAIPQERVMQFHLAGHADHGTHVIDTHDHPVCEEVWALYRRGLERFGEIPVLIEWDDRLPSFERLMEEAHTATKIMEDTLDPKNKPALPSGATNMAGLAIH